MGGRLRDLVLRGVAVIAIIGLSACATLFDSHGYVPDPELLDEIVVGQDTKETAERILGRPSTRGIVDDRGWYYVKSDYERFLWRERVEVDRQVIAVSFAENGVVSNVERFGLEDGQVVVLSRRVTTSNTQGVGFLRQLFSNIGNINPGDFFDG